jgi:transposase
MVGKGMRGDDQRQSHMFSYLSPEMRVRKDHPLRTIRAMVDEVLTQLSRRFDTMYARVGRPSIAPEELLRAQLLQMLYSIRSERLLMEEMDYNLLFRWFVGLNADDEVWDATTFSKNRDRLLEAEVAQEFLARVVAQARGKGLTSDEHFTVDGTLLEAWASLKSFQPKEGKPMPPPDDPGNPTVAAGLSLRICTLRTEMELVLAQNFPIRLYACDASTAVEALRRDLILFSRILVDPRQIHPALRIGYIGRDKMKFLGVNVRWIPKRFHMARQQRIEWFYPVAILFPAIEFCQ